MPTRENPCPDWARVRILLNTGQASAAGDLALAISQDTSWDLSRGIRCGLPYMLGVEDIPVGWAFFYQRKRGQWFMLLNDRVVDEFAMANVMAEFSDAAFGMKVSAWRRFDIENWRLLNAA